ncbi:hypothetical protein PLESTB_000782600 [Pleodorina starrii]|uniref:RING-type domain-containing protein n=1 Tax=Pleodorina starrii TaxID=330485 RepID=A0A9W6F2E3_9CHLO|nr:hypothetical protein PLESTB_000782600 [Pleodorina starrii]
MGADEQPNPTHHHHYGDRHHHGDRAHGRGGRLVSLNGMTVSLSHPAGATPLGGPAIEVERRVTPGGPLGGPTAAAQTSPFEPELQAGAVASAAAVAAATQPATLVKLDRGGPSRRTPLHVAAERGQLHVLSAIIENLCCCATAALLAEDSAAAAAPTDAEGDGDRTRNRATSAGDGSAAGARASGSPGAGDRALEPRGGGLEGVEDWTPVRQLQQQQQQHRQTGPMEPQRSSGLQQQQLQLQRGGAAMAEEFPVARRGAGGAPLAPDQYIQYHLNMQDADGMTALSLACRFGHVDCCRLLLANGSARTLSDARGNTPLHYAALRGHLGVLFMLLDEFVEPEQQEELSSYVDARNHAGCTPLHYAVWGRQSGSVQVLLQHGADVLPRNSRPAQELTPPVMVVGSTPLHLAAARGHVEICRIILKTFAERVLEPLQLGEDDPQPTTLASLDPRVQVNANGHMPYQVAQRLGFYPLAMLLRPSIPILRLFSDEERAVRFYGPAPLRAIAAEALNKKLLAELDALAAAAACVSAAGGGLVVRQGPGFMVASVGAAVSGGSAAGGDAAAAAGARRPVSAPATLEQLAAAAALEAAEAAAAARTSSPVSPTRTSGGGAAAAAAAAAGPMAAAGGAAAPGRRIVPPRQLNVEIAVAGGTRDNDGRPSSGARRPLVLEPAAGAAAAAAVGTHPSTPRTPTVGAQLVSPSAISPRLMSPMSLWSSTGSGGGGGSPTASLYPPHQSPSRGSSARRSTPPLGSNRSTPLPTSNRSSNAVLSAAPMVAALSRPPSAPRANGQGTDSSRAPVMLSLPGQPDADLEAPPGLRTQTPLRISQPQPGGLDQAVSDQAAAAASTAVGAPGMGADGTGGALVATDVATSLAAVDGEADGGGGGLYGPRTPARQPSAGALHVRRMQTSPQGGTGGAASNTNAYAGNGTGHGSGGGGGGSTGRSSSRPATSSLATAGSLGSAVSLESSPSVARRSIDDGRPPGLVRLRSNPLFEDVHQHQTNGAAAAAQLTTGGGAAAAAAGAAGGMPPLTEDSAEGDEGPAARSVPAAAGPSGGVALTPFSRLAGAAGGGTAVETASHGVSVGSAAAAAVAAAAAALAASGGGDDDEELECGVCMEPLPMVAIAPCRHQICGPCARRICCLNIQKPSHCPFCRATISAFVAPAPLTPTVK